MPRLAQSQEQVYPQELALGSLYSGHMTEPEGPKLEQPSLPELFMQDLLRMKEGYFLGTLWSHVPEHPQLLNAIPMGVLQPWRRELTETAPASVMVSAAPQSHWGP